GALCRSIAPGPADRSGGRASCRGTGSRSARREVADRAIRTHRGGSVDEDWSRCHRRGPMGPRVRSLPRLVRFALAAVTVCLAHSPPAFGAPPRETARRLAVVQAIETRGVRASSTLAALRVVPRHEFVPLAQRGSAYLDEPLPIGHGQTISQPSVVAIMTASIRPRPGMRVLE